MVACESLCILFDENKMAMRKSFFLLLLSVNTLEQWGVDEWDIAEVTFPYLNTTSANFQQDNYSHFAGYLQI